MTPALSQVCTLHSSFERDVEDYAAGKCQAIEIWLTKLETYLESHSFDDARRLLERHGMAIAAASYQGGLLISQGDARREHFAHFSRRLEMCKAVGIQLLIIAGDVTAPLSQEDFERLRMSLVQAAQQAGEFGVRLALEFQVAGRVSEQFAIRGSAGRRNCQSEFGIMPRCVSLFHRAKQGIGFGVSFQRQFVPRAVLRSGRHDCANSPLTVNASFPATAIFRCR